jgi:hypothetical protein
MGLISKRNEKWDCQDKKKKKKMRNKKGRGGENLHTQAWRSSTLKKETVFLRNFGNYLSDYTVP